MPRMPEWWTSYIQNAYRNSPTAEAQREHQRQQIAEETRAMNEALELLARRGIRPDPSLDLEAIQDEWRGLTATEPVAYGGVLPEAYQPAGHTGYWDPAWAADRNDGRVTGEFEPCQWGPHVEPIRLLYVEMREDGDI